ncbi:MAG: tRNA (adenosine(37)-N6)-dimethylallyltransferase MiaA [Rhodoferax sp.]|nr:tRNA (adenosine(37)-N6)-dimethylallyltransferase MiaA [Rhodoferax sp.]
MSSSALSADLPAFLALAGPTASGKTAAALAIAQQQAVEIISVDSALVYRGMDIGTAKPSADELAAVPHHLINIRDPLKAYSAADFVRDAQVLMKDIRSRGKLPLLVGGTMLYFKALWDGLDDMPTASPALRAELAAQAAAQGWPALHAELARVDPLTAARLQPQDSQRISRALEVFRVSGRPMSFFQRRIAPTQPAMEAVTAPAGLLISLEPANRAWLHQRIAQRFDAMLAAGFLDEVRGLRARADLHPDLPAMRCVGYRQAWTLLDNLDNLKTTKEVQQAEHDFREQGIAATRQLAKRQLTWLRSMPQRRVVACDAPDALAQVLALTAQCAGATA